MNDDNLSEYLRAAEPHKRERADNWRVAIGLQKVDGLATSSYLVDPTSNPTSNPASNPASNNQPNPISLLSAQLKSLLTVLDGEKSRQSLMKELGIKDRVSFSERYLGPALRIGYVEPTQPKSPRSPTQKYRLTAKGMIIHMSLLSNP